MRRIKPRHRLDIVVEHVGPGGGDAIDGARLVAEIGRQHFDGGAGRQRPHPLDAGDELEGAAIVEIVAVDRGDDDMLQAHRCHRFRQMFRFVTSTAPGLPVLTLQNAQARVQVSPRIMNVAWRCFQHSPILGQAASSHTVCRLLARIRVRTSAASAEVGALTRIQSGLRGDGLSGR